jgi:hypothetical protein
MFRSYDHHQAENILLARITQITTDPSTHRHYRRLILLLNTTYTATCFGHTTIFKLENTLLARITQLTTDRLFCTIANIIVIVFYI